MKKKNIFIVLLIIGLLLVPYNTSAISEKKKGEVKESGTRDSKDPQYSEAGANNACKSYLNMKITVGKYSRNANYDGSTYINEVSKRKITFTNNTGGAYKIFIYHGPIGSLDDLKNLSDKEIEKYNAEEADDDDEKDEDASVEKKIIKMKKTTKSKSWYLDVDEEALIVYMNGKKKETNLVYSGDCVSKDSDGNCTAWQELKISCPKGNIDAKKSTADEPIITGNALSIFVENPKNTGKVPNIKKSETVCSDARSGIYNGTSSEQELYNVTPEQQETWTNYYYDKLLKDFCSDSYVDFNLTEKNIKDLSNGLLKVFYYNNRIDELKNEGSIKDLQALEAIANQIKMAIQQKYAQLGMDYNSHIIEGNDKDLSTGLQCRYDKNSITNSSVKSLEEDYLYITGETTETAEITKTNAGLGRKTKSIDVCSTKCYEHLTVKYDVPKAVKAGICFSYKVTVKSKAECGIEVKNYWDELKKPDTCAPVAICENDEEHTQAGPNEDFDSCINECDGGKYSQSCINSCYNTVYKGKKKANTKKTSNNAKTFKVNKLVNRSFDKGDAKLERLANQVYTENQLKGYDDSDEVISICSTTSKIEQHKDECAEYFFEAKALYPKGTYECIYTNCSVATNQGGGNLKWKSSNRDDTSGIVKSPIGTKGTSIPEQIGRAAPFYLRDVPTTKELLTDLIGRYKSNGKWYKYVINQKGFKQNYSQRWVCHEKCSFTGCEKDKEDNVAYTSKEYSDNLILDLNSIQNALSKCTASTACDTEEKTTEYEINIKSNGASGEGGSIGTTSLGTTFGDASFINGDITESMFTSEAIDEFGNSTDPTTSTGILGLCYDDRDNPHYQTTITYPGTYINYKTGARKYTNTSDDTYYFKNKKFCTPYDDKDKNVSYAYWAIVNKYDPDTYPTGFTPEEYNVTAKLGKTNKGFGKYNWKVDFQCFYSSMTDLVTTCTPGEPDCPTGTCPKSDPNYPICSPPITTTNCPNDECKCSSSGSSRLCNLNFRVVDSTNLFPDPTKASGKKDEKDVAFNWTSKAQDMDTSTTYGQFLQSRGYMINPTEYRHSIEDTAGENSEYYYGGIPMYHIKLTRENIRDLKNYVKSHGYNSYEGSYSQLDSKIPFRYYNVSDNVKGYIEYFENSNAHLGYNNK